MKAPFPAPWHLDSSETICGYWSGMSANRLKSRPTPFSRQYSGQSSELLPGISALATSLDAPDEGISEGDWMLRMSSFGGDMFARQKSLPRTAAPSSNASRPVAWFSSPFIQPIGHSIHGGDE